MGILSWLVLGLIGGFIGGKIVNASGQGLLVDIALGIVGAIVGGAVSPGILGARTLSCATEVAHRLW